MRGSGELAAEVWRRVDLHEEKKARHKKIMACIACVFITAGLVRLSAQYPLDGTGHPVAAAHAPLMFPDAGGYVICGVIFFTLGVAVTLICLRWKEWQNQEGT